MYGDNATLDVTNNSVKDAEQGAEVKLYGDVTTLTLNVDGGFSSGEDGGYADVGFSAGADNFVNMTSVTINGNGAAQIWIDNNEGAALATIDASGLAADADYGFFSYSTDNASVVESITLGDSVENITIDNFVDVDGNTQFGSNRGAMDTITGFDFETDTISADATFILVAADDLVGSSLTTILQNLATDTAVDAFVFEYQGNTYLYGDVAEGATEDTLSSNDLLVKIVGTAGMEADGYAGTWVDWAAAV